MPQEVEGLRKRVNQAAEKLEETADLDPGCCSCSLGTLHAFQDGKTKVPKITGTGKKEKRFCRKGKTAGECPVIAVAKDEAFCFYYEDNHRLLEAYGGKLVWFSPLGRKNSEGSSAITTGRRLSGVMPAAFRKCLNHANSIRSQLKMVCRPWLKECSRFMYLHESMTDEEGENNDGGVITGSCHNKGKTCTFWL